MRTYFESDRHRHARHCGARDGGGRHGGLGRGDASFGRGGRGGRGGGGRQRVFDHGALRLVVLALIAEAPRHGYELIKAIEERLAGSYSPSPGVIYPTLTLLQELGHATVEEGEGKKRYSITDEGRRYLVANQPAVDAALARMQAVNARHGGGPAPQIIRAMENLKLALRLRMNRGPLSDDELAQVAAALDTAAVTIERS
ncbi:MAG: PadR family transcriptional regulator [Steroidobacteraceae bacterium]